MIRSYRERMKPYLHKQRKNLQGEPLVGGEPAHRILHIVRSFPLSVTHAGGVKLEYTAEGADREMFERAYAWIEMEFLEHESRCVHRASHSTVDAAQYQWMILNELVFWAKFALNDFGFEALWASLPLRNQFGPKLPGEVANHDHAESL